MVGRTGLISEEQAGAQPAVMGDNAAMLVLLIACSRTPQPVPSTGVQLGPRPYYLVDALPPSPLKSRLMACADGPFVPSDFSIGHRGAPLQFPEHTAQSYRAAARMGAGIIECDVAFTADQALVCRHAQCDLHTTTDILTRPALAAKCTEPFSPADPTTGTPASARCCTSDLTLAEFKTLCGKMDAFDPTATTPAAYLGGTSADRTDLYTSCGTVLSHAESIALLDGLGADFAPELKAPEVEMPFAGQYTQADYARQLIAEYEAAGIAPERVYPQSFSLADVRLWLTETPQFGAQAIYLDARPYEEPDSLPAVIAGMDELASAGVPILAPPLFALLTLDASGAIVPSAYAEAATAAGLDLIPWTLERSGRLAGGGGFYYQSIAPAIDSDGDALVVLDVLAEQVGIRAIFTDWPATVTYYANCTGR